MKATCVCCCCFWCFCVRKLTLCEQQVSLSQGRLYKRAEDRAARGCTEMKSKNQTVLRGGQHSKRMAHILPVENAFMKGQFITSLGGHSSFNPPTTFPNQTAMQSRICMAARFSKTHSHEQNSSLYNDSRETHSFWQSLQEVLDPETRPSESPASEK